MEEDKLYLVVFHEYMSSCFLHGFEIFIKDELNFFIGIWKNGFYRQKNGYEFDRRGYVEWDNFEAFSARLRIIEISETEADFLDKAFKNRKGDFPHRPHFEAF